MLHARDEDDVPCTQVLRPPGVRHEVDALCGATGENDLVLRGGSDEMGDLFACGLKGLRGAVAQLMQCAVHIGVVPLVVVRERLNDGAWLLATGGIVQIHQRVPMHLLIEDGEVRTYSVPVHVCGEHT